MSSSVAQQREKDEQLAAQFDALSSSTASPTADDWRRLCESFRSSSQFWSTQCTHHTSSSTPHDEAHLVSELYAQHLLDVQKLNREILKVHAEGERIVERLKEQQIQARSKSPFTVNFPTSHLAGPTPSSPVQTATQHQGHHKESANSLSASASAPALHRRVSFNRDIVMVVSADEGEDGTKGVSAVHEEDEHEYEDDNHITSGIQFRLDDSKKKEHQQTGSAASPSSSSSVTTGESSSPSTRSSSALSPGKPRSQRRLSRTEIGEGLIMKQHLDMDQLLKEENPQLKQ